MRFHFAPGLPAALLGALGMGRGHSWLDVEGDRFRVRMGWAFRLGAPAGAVASAEEVVEPIPLLMGIGVHGWARRWVVNSARKPHVVVRFAAPQRAWVLGFPVRVEILHLSPADPTGFLAALRAGPARPGHRADGNG
jgi:hypothetical protein